MKKVRIRMAVGLLAIFAVSVQCSSSGGGAGLEWNEVVEDINGDPETIFGYRVHYGTASGGYSDSFFVEGSVAVDFSALTLAPDTLYYFAVTAVDLAGNESDPSNEVEYRAPGT